MKLTITLDYYGVVMSASIDNEGQDYPKDRTIAEALFETIMGAADVTDQEEEANQ